MTHTLEFGGELLELHPWGVLYWKRESLLIVSDVHFGKVTHFRKYGAAVPQKALERNFIRMDCLLQDFRPARVCFLGDLFHSHLNREWDLFSQWAVGCPAALELVLGNHDILSPTRYEALGIRCGESFREGPFLFTHYPMDAFEGFNIAGHIHPAVRLKGPGKERLRLPCFFIRGRQLIVPAFGAFTGSHVLEPRKGDRAFALAGEAVIALDEAAPGRP
ncbi:ligase-associated DNA damage response endonuclease PdeM [Robiginitalea marina]|uniref:Ligase-associated DNA damage response endonuclease PdeM n=1 Tax=Robiginitalea marina TaxID=2954105 RepID=A0ABT1AZT6_9FLAO|nr:ligase-associated DNA damage response endonuclease PdeM [Robiginitalea marina]MCO5725100.1 ligase-associated DNA damage response endonuclease PdeM [Robiginitalea marina]